MKTVKETLIEGKARIADPDNWIKHQYALDKDGKTCISQPEEAVCFCSLGALMNVRDLSNAGLALTLDDSKVWQENLMVHHAAVESLAEAASPGEGKGQHLVAQYNDDHTHEEVMALWDKAIEKA